MGAENILIQPYSFATVYSSRVKAAAKTIKMISHRVVSFRLRSDIEQSASGSSHLRQSDPLERQRKNVNKSMVKFRNSRITPYFGTRSLDLSIHFGDLGNGTDL